MENNFIDQTLETVTAGNFKGSPGRLLRLEGENVNDENPIPTGSTQFSKLKSFRICDRSFIIFRMMQYISMLLLVLITSPCTSQDKIQVDDYYKLPLKAFIGNQVAGLPFQNIFSRLSPGFMVGTEVFYNRSTTHKIGQTLDSGMFSNEVLGNTITLNSDFFYRYSPGESLYTEIGLGIGGIFQFLPRKHYKHHNDTGGWQEMNDTGKLSRTMGANIGIGYDFHRTANCPVSVAIKHRFIIQEPYFDYKTFPVMPQSFSGIEITYKIRKNEK